MTLLQGVRRGEQSPRVRVVPSSAVDFEDGVEAVDLSSGYGLTADPWQADVVKSWLARDKYGFLAAGRCGLSVPRQNGKNGAIEIVQLHKLVFQGRRILHSAHEVKTARKAFMRLRSFFENTAKFPELAALVSAVRSANGQEAIYLSNGASIEFVARTRGSARGFTVDDLFIDEAQELTDEQLEALMPTVSAAPSGDPQMVFTGTPPGPRTAGTVFARIRKEAVGDSPSDRFVWHEWSVPDRVSDDDVTASWVDHVFATNPGLGIRLRLKTVEDELAAMSADGFARERCGRWDAVTAGSAAIDFGAWESLVSVAPESGRRVFGVRFSVDGSSVALGAAIRPDDGPVHVEGIQVSPMGEGTQWLVDWLVEKHKSVAQIVVDGKFGAGYLVNALRDEGVPARIILTPSTDQVISAHSMFEQGISNGLISHLGQKVLDSEVQGALKRKIGLAGGFGWSAPDGGSVVLLEAVTLAHWGARVTKRNPRSGKSGVRIL